ncbi:MAG: hypothetical protein EOO69_13565 [Moraxellaceae bacterium]|nr:MAG: hypothetical protein EOO69_13565 [Moraxellaceae bacterium]
MRAYLALLPICLMASCSGQDQERIRQQFDARQPDTAVLNRLPLYDSLRRSVLAKLPEFFPAADLEQMGNRWKWARNAFFLNTQGELQQLDHRDSSEVRLPAATQLVLLEQFEQIGDNNIFGFEIGLDSTFIALVRNEYVKEFHLDIRERLTWSAKPDSSAPSEFSKTVPVADHWTYLIWYDKRSGW